jgi:hypothetical protein
VGCAGVAEVSAGPAAAAGWMVCPARTMMRAGVSSIAHLLPLSCQHCACWGV